MPKSVAGGTALWPASRSSYDGDVLQLFPSFFAIQLMQILKTHATRSFAKGIACRNPSATRAYIEAGYETSGEARTSASELMTNPDVRDRIRELQQEIA